MAEIARDIYVDEVMTRSPVKGDPGMTAREAAQLMKKKEVGSLVIVENNQPVGILTEKDLVEKVVSENLLPSKVIVENIMSAPLVIASPGDSVVDAAERMAHLKLRRLPVVDDGSLVGILTENDILRISPSLIEITREWAKINSSGLETESFGISTGYCEICGAYSDMLMHMDGRLLCSDCLEMEK
ncbi:MAG TPA: CBS domain-containing protein [Methanomassiliicoccales archaeon]|nr:CBS domain-containing protein [Methanomassiliicoccales archaeon]